LIIIIFNIYEFYRTIAKNRISPGSAGNPPEEVIIKFSEEHQLKEL